MKKTKILIADSNEEFVNEIQKKINSTKDMEIVGIAKSGVETVDFIINNQPDIVLLEMIFKDFDGLKVLEKLNKKTIKKQPIFIVLTSFYSEKLIQKATNLGAEHYILKSVSINLVIQRLREFTMKTEGNILAEANTEYINLSQSFNNIEATVSNLIHKLGFSPHLKGYQFIREAIIMTINEIEVIGQITKLVYPDIAIKCYTTPTRVERAIRHSIEVAFLKKKNSKLCNMFENIKVGDRPTNSEFISVISEKLRLELNYINAFK